MLSDRQQAWRTGSYSGTSCAQAEVGSATPASSISGTSAFHESSQMDADPAGTTG